MAEKNKTIWGEVPSGATPRAESSSSHKFDPKWLLAGLIVVVLLIAAVFININHNNNSISSSPTSLDIDNGDLKINWERYPTTDIELTESLTIANSGIYHVTGSLDSGSILINPGSNGVVKLILDNVSIKNSNGPAINCISGDDLVIELIGENYLVDGAKYSSVLE